MYFDPLSAWLVTLIVNGILIADENSGGRKISEYKQDEIKRINNHLNADIRSIKEKYGLRLSELAYKQIELHIKIIKNSYSFKSTGGQIIIDLDNQEYIINILEECAKNFSQYESKEYREKAEWYKNAAIEARQRKELYAKKLEVNRMMEAKQKEINQTLSNVCLIVGAIIFTVFIIFLLS